MKPSLLILAAGMGSRYGGLKQLDHIGPSGETIMDYSIYDALKAGFGKIVFVIRRDLEDAFKAHIFPKYRQHTVDYVFQDISDLPVGFTSPENRLKPWGTGHAVLVAQSKIETPFAVINADDFYGASAFKLMVDFLKNNTNPKQHVLVTYDLEKTTSQYGSVSRGICRLDSNSNLLSVVEHSKIEMQNGHLYSLINEQRIKLNKSNQTSMNFIGFSAEVFENISMYFRNFLQQNISHPNAEFFLPDILRQLIADKKGIVKCIHTDEQWFGVTYKQDKIKVKKSIKNLIKSGQYPSQLFG